MKTKCIITEHQATLLVRTYAAHAQDRYPVEKEAEDEKPALSDAPVIDVLDKLKQEHQD